MAKQIQISIYDMQRAKQLRNQATTIRESKLPERKLLADFDFNPDFPLGDFSHLGESALIAIAGIDVTCSNGNH